MLKHYVEYFYRYRKEFIEAVYPKEFKLYEQIAERDPKLVNVPKNACAYRFFDVDQTGKICNFSGMTYFGKVYTLEEVKKQYPQRTTLIHNMECNGWNKVVQTYIGWRRLTNEGMWFHLEDGDTVIE